MSRLVAALAILLVLSATIAWQPQPREPAELVARRLCKSRTVTASIAALQASARYDQQHYARAATVAIIALEEHNRPALRQIAEEILFATAASVIPRIDRMTLGPGQISREFFAREIAPLAPEARFPEAIVSASGARRLIEAWVSSRLPPDGDALYASADAMDRHLHGIFAAFHGANDEIYLTAGSSIAAKLCNLRRA
jgi:hypothetical protein